MAISLRSHSQPRKTLITKSRQESTFRDVRFWLGLILILGSVTAGTRILGNASHRSPAVVALHSLAAGATVTSEDVSLVNVAVPSDVATISRVDDVVGKVLTQPLTQGALIVPGIATSDTAPESRTIALPIRAGHLPAVQRGSLVDVWVTPSLDGVAVPGPSTLVIKNALVADVPSENDPTSDTNISLQVDSSHVQPLVQAMRDGLIDVVVVAGAEQ